MILPTLFITFLGITSVIASQSSSHTNVCIEALLSEPSDAKDFCIRYLLLSTIPVPSFASLCLGTNSSDNRLFKSCYEVLAQSKKELPLPAALHFDAIDKPSKRAKSLPRDGGFFNTGSISSVSTNVGTYDNVGCFEDGIRGKPLGSPLLSLTGGPTETIQNCVNACSVSGPNGIPYLYAGVEPGSCWCSNYISILSIKSASYCQSSCPSTSGRYCGGIVGGILHMQIYELKSWSGNVNPTSRRSVQTTFSSSLKSSVKSSSSTFQSRTLTSTSKFLILSSKTTSTQKSSSVREPESTSTSARSLLASAISTTLTTGMPSSSLPTNPGSTPMTVAYTLVKPSSSTSNLSSLLSIKTSGSFPVSSNFIIVSSPSSSGSPVSFTSSPTASEGLASNSGSVSSISAPPDISKSTASKLTVSEPFMPSETSSTSLALTAELSNTSNSFGLPPDPPTIPPIVGPTGTESYVLPSGTFAYPSEVSTTKKPNPWVSLSLVTPDYYTQINSDAVPGDSQYTPAPLPPPPSPVITSISFSTITGSSANSSSSFNSSKSLPQVSSSPGSIMPYTSTTSPPPSTSSRPSNPTNPWAGLSLEEPDYYTQIPSGAVPEYVEPTETVPHVSSETSSSETTSLPPFPPQKAKREYDIHAPDSPWATLLPLSSPEIIKQVPQGQVPGWSQQPAAPPATKSKRGYDINAPESPWLPLLPLSSPEIVKEVSPGQVPGWSQQPVSKAKREYDITAPDSPWASLLPLSSPEIVKQVPPGQVPGWSQQSVSPHSSDSKEKREYDITSPDSPWLSLLPLSRPEIIKEVPPDQVPGWKGQPSAPLIPDSDIPPKYKAKAKPRVKLHRRQIGGIPENALEPPGRPDFIKQFPEKNNNKLLPPPFDEMKDPVDPKTGKKTEKKGPKYSHSKISLKKRPSLKDVGLQQDGRKIDENAQNGKPVSQGRIKEDKYRHTLHLQGTPRAYTEMEEEMARRQRGKVKNTMEEWEKKIFGGFWKVKEDWNENEPVLREDAIINKVSGNDDEPGVDEEDWVWRKWSGGKRSGGRKIQLERV